MSLRGWQPSEIQAGPGGRPSPERHWLRTGSPGRAGGTAPHVVTGRRERVTGRGWRWGGHRALEGVGAGGHAPVSHPVPSTQRGLCGFSLKEVTAHYTVPRDRKILSFTLLPEQAAQTLVSPYCGRRGDALALYRWLNTHPPLSVEESQAARARADAAFQKALVARSPTAAQPGAELFWSPWPRDSEAPPLNHSRDQRACTSVHPPRPAGPLLLNLLCHGGNSANPCFCPFLCG